MLILDNGPYLFLQMNSFHLFKMHLTITSFFVLSWFCCLGILSAFLFVTPPLFIQPLFSVNQFCMNFTQCSWSQFIWTQICYFFIVSVHFVWFVTVILWASLCLSHMNKTQTCSFGRELKWYEALSYCVPEVHVFSACCFLFFFSFI